MATGRLHPFDPTDWPSIMFANRNWLASVVYARVKDAHAVDEVLQETALAASQQMSLADDENGVCRWLYRVAIRQAILYRRRQFRTEQKIQRVGELHAGGVAANGASENPYSLLLASENRELVRVAMSKLDSRDCEILILKHVEGWSCRDVSERLGVNQSTVKSRLLRARQNLRIQLLRLQNEWGTQ